MISLYSNLIYPENLIKINNSRKWVSLKLIYISKKINLMIK